MDWSRIDRDALEGWAIAAAALLILTGIVWFVRWRRNPDEFRRSWRRMPLDRGTGSHGRGGTGKGY